MDRQLCREGAWGLWSDVRKGQVEPEGSFFVFKRGDCMAYIALYRKWRPDSFKNLVGQEHVSRTLSNAITTGHVGHAYLFSGPRGTGKTSTAKILAKSLNCEQGPTLEPCGVCESCRRIADGTSMDVYEIDAASNRGIDEIRDLRETVQYAPVLGHHKVYIIDEVHMLTTEAFNALLKTLEEPPAHVVFILATTEAHKVPATIQSRCQRYDFKRITVDDIFNRLKLVTSEMQVDSEDDALRMIAIRADGGMRDALSILDQCVALSGGKLTMERVQQLLGLIGREWIGKLAGAIGTHDAGLALKMVADLLAEGKDLQQLLTELSEHFHSLMIFQATSSLENAGFYQDAMEMARSQVRMFTREQMMGILRRLHEAMNEVKWSPQPRISVEAVLMELCQGLYESKDTAGNFNVSVSNAPVAQSNVDTGRIARLESKLEQMMTMLQQLQSQPVTIVKAEQQEAAPVTKPVERSASVEGDKGDEASDQVNSSGGMDLEAAWEKIKAEEKSALLSNSMRVSKLKSIEGNVIHVLVSRSLVRDIIIKKKQKLENKLKELTGKSWTVSCTSEEEAAAPLNIQFNQPKMKKQEAEPEIYTDETMVEHHKDKTVNLDALPQQQRDVLKNAMDVFGGHFVEINDEVTEEAVSDEPVSDTSMDEIHDYQEIPMPTDSDYQDVPMPSDEDFQEMLLPED